MTITTDRLTLRPVTLQDTDFILKANTGNVRDYFIPFNTPEAVQAWIQENLEKMERGEKLELVCVGTEDGQPVGMVAVDSLQDLKKIVPRLWISEAHQGQGFASEALSGLLAAIKGRPEHKEKTVVYEVDTDNEVSIKLAQKLGFTYQGKEMGDGEEYLVFVNR